MKNQIDQSQSHESVSCREPGTGRVVAEIAVGKTVWHEQAADRAGGVACADDGSAAGTSDEVAYAVGDGRNRAGEEILGGGLDAGMRMSRGDVSASSTAASRPPRWASLSTSRMRRNS
jgi:hypothetical protein